MHVTFSTTPLKCCHFTLRYVNRYKKFSPLPVYTSFSVNCSLLFLSPCDWLIDLTDWLCVPVLVCLSVCVSMLVCLSVCVMCCRRDLMVARQCWAAASGRRVIRCLHRGFWYSQHDTHWHSEYTSVCTLSALASMSWNWFHVQLSSSNVVWESVKFLVSFMHFSINWTLTN